jgi:hypothetical protein
VEALLAKLACHVKLGEAADATIAADVIVKRSAKMAMVYPGIVGVCQI